MILKQNVDIDNVFEKVFEKSNTLGKYLNANTFNS